MSTRAQIFQIRQKGRREKAPCLSQALDIVLAYRKAGEDVSHTVGTAHGLLGTNDNTLICGLLLRHVSEKTRENYSHRPSVIGNAAKLASDFRKVREIIPHYTNELTLKQIEGMKLLFRKEPRLIPLLVADYFQHLMLHHAHHKTRAFKIENLKQELGFLEKKGRLVEADAKKKRLELLEAEHNKSKIVAHNGRVLFARLAQASKWDLAGGIQDHAFEMLEPENFERISRYYSSHDLKALKKYEKLVKRALLAQGIKARVESRLKGKYSTHREILDKKENTGEELTPKDMHDRYGIRVILSTDTKADVAAARKAILFQIANAMRVKLGNPSEHVERPYYKKEYRERQGKPHYRAHHDLFPKLNLEIQTKDWKNHFALESSNENAHYNYKTPVEIDPQLEPAIQDLLKIAHSSYNRYEAKRIELHTGEKVDAPDHSETD